MDAFVAVLDTVNRKLVYSTYFGGPEPDDRDGLERRRTVFCTCAVILTAGRHLPRRMLSRRGL